MPDDRDEQGYNPQDSNQYRENTRKTSDYVFQSCPICPDLTRKINSLGLALLGEDGTGLNDGVIHSILEKLIGLEVSRTVTASWVSFVKPVAISIFITAVTTWALTKFV